MFKHTITYSDFNGTERTEELHFHLSRPEVIRLEAEIGKPLAVYTKEISANQDLKTMINFLQDMILSAYGRKTSDGKSFYKSQELRKEFEYSHAYAEIFEQLLVDEALARKFGEQVADTGQKKKNQTTPTVVNN